MRNLDWLIDSIEYDHLEDHADVNGDWTIRRQADDESVVIVRYQPYDDGSAEFEYPHKVTKYRVVLLETVEGDAKEVEEAFNKWQ